jgi:hypothetical protein
MRFEQIMNFYQTLFHKSLALSLSVNQEDADRYRTNGGNIVVATPGFCFEYGFLYSRLIGVSIFSVRLCLFSDGDIFAQILSLFLHLD